MHHYQLPPNSICERHLKIDTALNTRRQSIKIIQHIFPLNFEQERDNFLSNFRENPNFKYPAPAYDIKELEKEILSLKILDEPLDRLFHGVQEEILDMNTFVRNVGDKEVCLKISEKMFGRPDHGLLQRAEEILKERVAGSPNMEENSQTLAAAFSDCLKDLGLADWQVEVSKDLMAIIVYSEKIIKIPAHRKYSKLDIERLKIHEIGVHALRFANGHHQPLKILASGLKNYLETEEGLAVWAESISGTLDPKNMKTYAGRVIAVDSVYNNLDFKTTFERLMDHSCFSSEEAFTLTARVFRGGGYLKDLIYLRGFLKVQDYFQSGGSLKTLYAGKISLEQLGIVSGLIEQNILHPPVHTPWFANGFDEAI